MEAQKASETLNCCSILTRLVARDYFIAIIITFINIIICIIIIIKQIIRLDRPSFNTCTSLPISVCGVS
jgi:hypothetical protein